MCFEILDLHCWCVLSGERSCACIHFLMAGAVFGVLFVLQASKNMAGNVICEVLLLTRYSIVARPAIASFGRALFASVALCFCV